MENTLKTPLIHPPIGHVSLSRWTELVKAWSYTGASDAIKAFRQYLIHPIRIDPREQQLSEWIAELPLLSGATGYKPRHGVSCIERKVVIMQNFASMLEREFKPIDKSGVPKQRAEMADDNVSRQAWIELEVIHMMYRFFSSDNTVHLWGRLYYFIQRMITQFKMTAAGGTPRPGKMPIADLAEFVGMMSCVLRWCASVDPYLPPPANYTLVAEDYYYQVLGIDRGTNASRLFLMPDCPVSEIVPPIVAVVLATGWTFGVGSSNQVPDANWLNAQSSIIKTGITDTPDVRNLGFLDKSVLDRSLTRIDEIAFALLDSRHAELRNAIKDLSEELNPTSSEKWLLDQISSLA